MSHTLRIDNFGESNVVEETRLNADSALGVQAFTVDNNNNFAANDFFIVGPRGAETSDQLVVQSVSGALIVNSTAVSKRAHNRFDQVTKLFGDQIKVYRAANVDGSQPADASFSALGSPTAIDFDQLYTVIEDSAGSSSYWYKYTYRNSTTASETAIADSPAFRGGLIDYATLFDIRQQAGLSGNRWITNYRIDIKRKVAEDLINSTLIGIYTIPFTNPVNPLIAECTRLLAAGYLLTDDYGPTGTLNTNEGQQMIDRVTNDKKTGLLDRLNTKDLVLPDTSGADQSIPGSAGGFSGWPNDTTKDASYDDAGSERMFRASDTSGNGGRY